LRMLRRAKISQYKKVNSAWRNAAPKPLIWKEKILCLL
jgi:hypothetical protein